MEAANTMRDAGNTLVSGSSSTQRMNSNAMEAWSQYVRGTTTIETEENGTRTREVVNRDFGRYWVEQFPNEYREVPTSELTPR
jgi:hypothetical protein